MHTKLLSYIAFLLIAGIFLTSCERYRCIEGNGNRVTEDRNPGNFQGIDSDGPFEIYVIYDTSLTQPLVKIEGDENVLPYIETRVISGNLEIKTVNNRCLETERPVYIDVFMPELNFIKLSGSGLIRVNGLVQERLRIDLLSSGTIEVFNLDAGYVDVNHYGSGLIELSGTAVECDYTLTGSGQIRAKDLEIDGCYILLSGSGDMYVYAWNFIEGEISGSGMLFYRVRPIALRVKITGSGGMRLL